MRGIFRSISATFPIPFRNKTTVHFSKTIFRRPYSKMASENIRHESRDHFEKRRRIWATPKPAKRESGANIKRRRSAQFKNSALGPRRGCGRGCERARESALAIRDAKPRVQTSGRRGSGGGGSAHLRSGVLGDQQPASASASAIDLGVGVGARPVRSRWRPLLHWWRRPRAGGPARAGMGRVPAPRAPAPRGRHSTPASRRFRGRAPRPSVRWRYRRTIGGWLYFALLIVVDVM